MDYIVWSQPALSFSYRRQLCPVCLEPITRSRLRSGNRDNQFHLFCNYIHYHHHWYESFLVDDQKADVR